MDTICATCSPGRPGPRHEFLYWTDGGDIAGLRYNQWKLVFMEQRAHGFDVWEEPMVTLRLPKIFSLRADPFERADHEGIRLQSLEDRSDVSRRSGASLYRAVAPEFRGLPPAPRAGQLLAQPGDGEADGFRSGRQLADLQRERAPRQRSCGNSVRRTPEGMPDANSCCAALDQDGRNPSSPRSSG